MGEVLDCAYALLGCLPLEWLEPRFMRQALIGLLLLAPMASALGVEVVIGRMAFFSDAIGHSAFAGVALGLLGGVSPELAMMFFGVFVGLAVMAVRRASSLSADTAIGIVFSAVVAFGLAVVSRAQGSGRQIQQFLFGDVLTITEGEIGFLALLFAALLAFQCLGYNRLLLTALNPVMARAHGVRVALWQYGFAALLALVVMFALRAVGVLLVTALLIVPAATARNLARSAAGMFWWALVVGTTSAVAGLALSAQEWFAAASGASIILVACCWFAVSLPVAAARRRG